MDLDQGAAAAIAAWERFDEEVTDELLRAVAGAFAIVSAADGDIAEAEVDRFVGLVLSQDAFARLDGARLELLFRELGQAMITDFADGKRRAFDLIGAVRGDRPKSELVVSAAQIAVVADQRLRDAEEALLREVCQALGIDPDDR